MPLDCGYRCTDGWDVGMGPEYGNYIENADPYCPEHGRGDQRDDLVFEEGDVVQLVHTPNGKALQWVNCGKVIDSWALHLEPAPSPELAKRLLRSWIVLMEERDG